MENRQIKQPFILTPEIPYSDPRRKEMGNIWYPFWNAESAYVYYDTYLQWVLLMHEAQIAARSKSSDIIMASRQKFLYRVPSTPAEEMFCRGQF